MWRLQCSILNAISVLFICAAACNTSAEPLDDARATLSDLVVKLERSEIDRVDILAIAPYTFTRIQITPQGLESGYDYRFTIRMLRGGGFEQEVKRATMSLSVKTALTEPPDLRWGVIFYDLNGNRVAAVYFDRNGKSGVVGETPASFGGEFFDWLDQTFSRLIR
jgi:hypothetical protein